MARPALLSPRRYLASGYGASLPDDFSYATLRTTIVRAQSIVDRYCNVPRQPTPFDWRGGTMTDERQQWNLVNPLAYGPGARRVYTNTGPIKTVTAFHLDLGLTYTIEIPTDQLYINPMEQYVEVIALSPIVIAYYPQAVSLGLFNPIARVSYTYGWDFPVTGDVLEADNPSQFSAAYANWSTLVVPTVYFDGTEVDPDDYTVSYDDGIVTFSAGNNPGVGVEVTADYTYLPPSAIPDAIGLTTTMLLGSARMAQRDMIGLQSIKVAEVALTALAPSQTTTKNGATIPSEAADLLDGYVFGSIF